MGQEAGAELPTDNVGTHGKEPRFFSNPSQNQTHWELREG